ncbi:MAG: CoA transferase [Gammaproteobacteria bacterium]|nr:CoA transferase [Gammaproteobacteria bacterium]MYF28576.1 CoA transferase [Gammaproteobacteria bacterium]MYK46676.1 CoA transferase [Gammaproteobacteria bacterium]
MTRPPPLAGVRVLDTSEGIGAPFCAKLLGDLGADVVKVERPGTGDETREMGPFPDDAADGPTRHEASASFFFLNTSKRSVVLAAETTRWREQLAALVQRFDVVVAGETAESLDARGIGYDALRRWNPEVVLTTISGFGSFGPHSAYESSHLVSCAVGGWTHLCGLPDAEPLQVGGALSETLAGAFAAAATQLAVLGRMRHGRGDHVDVSVQQAVLAGAQIPTMLYEYRGIVPERYSSVGAGAGACCMLPTADGTIGINALTGRQWRMLCDFFGRRDIADDERYRGVSWVNADERVDEIRAAFREALGDRTAEALFHQAQAWRVPFGLVPDMAGMFALPPHRHRGFIVPLDHPVAGTVEVPGIPFRATGTEPRPYRPPLLGEHTEQVLSSLAEAPPSQSGETPDGDSPLPLDGVRVLDLSMFFAGPVCAQIAADAGAEVIKVESVQRIDGWRGSAASHAGTDLPGWESSPYFNWVNRNKRGITLNLKDARGVSIIKRMVRDADILIENYTPRVMANFGLDYDTLREINPRLVMISLSGFGADSPWRDYVAFGMSTEQMAGFTHLTGYPDGEPLFTGTTGGDLFAGVMGANALFAALNHRDRTGEGQHIDFGQVEACSLYVGDAMTGWSLAGVDPGRVGNGHHHYPLQGVYPCRDNRWIAITCKTADHCAALAELIGDAAVAEGAAGCRDAIAAWTAPRDHVALMADLQAAGIPAGAVMNGPDLLADTHLAARGGLLVQDRPGLGPRRYPAQPYRFRRAAPPPNERAPLLGEHSSEILREYAGLTDDDIAELVIDDVVGTVPIAAR